MSTASRIDTAPAPSSDERANDILSPDALDFIAELHGRFEPTRQELLAARRERDREAARRRHARLPRGDEGDPRGRLDRPRAVRRLQEPPRRDHRPDRPQARHQRLELGRQGLHGRPRGLDRADVGERRRRPREPDRRDRPHDHLRRVRRQALRARRRDRDAAAAPARLAPQRQAREGRGHRGLGRPARLRALLLPQRPAAARRRLAPVLLLPEDGAPPRGAAVERRAHVRRGRDGRAARLGARDGADRDAPRGVPDGRDPLRAARPLVRAQRRPLGLHLLDDQVLPGPRGLRAPRPQRREDDRAVHEGLHGAAGQDLPPPRRVRDGRHGGADPVAQGRGGQPARDRRRARGQGARGRRPASTAPGSRTRTSSTSLWRRSTPCSATSPTRSTSSATTSR